MTDKKPKTKAKAKVEPKADGKFSKDNQPKGRGKSKKTLILDALKAASQTEEQFWQAVVKKAMFGGSDGDGDSQMMALVGKKLFPDSKATFEEYEIPLTDGDKRLDRAEAILKAAMNGLMPIDVAERFINSLADVAKIEEVDSILERLAIIEESLKND